MANFVHSYVLFMNSTYRRLLESLFTFCNDVDGDNGNSDDDDVRLIVYLLMSTGAYSTQLLCEHLNFDSYSLFLQFLQEQCNALPRTLYLVLSSLS